MSSPQASAEYLQDKKEFTEDLKEDGRILQVVSVQSSSGYNPTITKTLVDHYCIPMSMTAEDVDGNLRLGEIMFAVDAENVIKSEDKLIDLGVELEIVDIESINLDGISTIGYIVTARK